MKPLQKKLIALSEGLFREAGDLPQDTKLYHMVNRVDLPDLIDVIHQLHI